MSKFESQASGSGFQGPRFRAEASNFQGVGSKAKGLGFMVYALGFRVRGLELEKVEPRRLYIRLQRTTLASSILMRGLHGHLSENLHP